MKSIFCRIAMLFLFPAFTYAESTSVQQQKAKSDANITGHVESADTKEHLPYITVALKGTTIGTVTDASGHYFLKNLPEGEYVIVASSLGYKSSEQKVKVVANKLLEVNFLLEEEAIRMDEVVVSSSRNETNRMLSPTIVNVASKKLFETTASCNLAESMNFQPGLRIETNCGNCGTTQLRINGLDGQYSQILLDSRPIFSSLASVYGLEQLPVSMIERVEVVRGGGSALFGSNAIGGVVNIITKEPLRNSATVSNTTNFFENGKSDINTSLNASLVTDDYKAGIYIFGMMKRRDWYDKNNDGFSEIPKIDSETLGFRGYYKTGAYSRVTAEYHHIHEFRRGGNNFDRPPHEADIAEQLNHNIDGGGLRYDMNTPDYKHRFGVYTSAQNIRRDSYFGTDKNPDAYGDTKDVTFVGGAQYTYAFDRFWFLPAELTAGFEYNYNSLRDKFLSLSRDFSQTTHVGGGFLQNEWKNKEWSFLIGARLDKHNKMKNVVVNPRVNLRYNPTEKVGLRASYSSGYRAPQAYNEDLHIDAVSGVLSIIRLAPGLKPEYSHSISASADLYFNMGRMQANFLAEGFYTILNDVFTLEKTGETDPEGNIILERRNASGATVKGLNLEAKMGIPGIFELQMGYTFQRSRYKEPEQWSENVAPQKKMFRSPDNYGYITSNFNITRDFKASLFGNLTGSMLVRHNAGYIEYDTECMTPVFFDMGVKFAYNFHITSNLNLELNAGVKNIFDSYQRDLDYGIFKDASYIYGPSLPRMFFVGLKASL